MRLLPIPGTPLMSHVDGNLIALSILSVIGAFLIARHWKDIRGESRRQRIQRRLRGE